MGRDMNREGYEWGGIRMGRDTNNQIAREIRECVLCSLI